MKAISLWQPWATLVAIGAKRIETRSWEPNYRGLIAIHAAKRWTRETDEVCTSGPIADALRAAGLLVNEGPARLKLTLPMGTVVCVARLTDVYRIGERGGRVVLSTATQSKSPTAKEIAFGNYTPGRYGWQLDDVRPLKTPFPVAGRQSLFEIPDSVMAMCATTDDPGGFRHHEVPELF